jgi:hypothetical protein
MSAATGVKMKIMLARGSPARGIVIIRKWLAIGYSVACYPFDIISQWWRRGWHRRRKLRKRNACWRNVSVMHAIGGGLEAAFRHSVCGMKWLGAANDGFG